ncbi:hypothetical protein Dimus_017689, partial [Dionaea muscipula]
SHIFEPPRPFSSQISESTTLHDLHPPRRRGYHYHQTSTCDFSISPEGLRAAETLFEISRTKFDHIAREKLSSLLSKTVNANHQPPPPTAPRSIPATALASPKRQSLKQQETPLVQPTEPFCSPAVDMGIRSSKKRSRDWLPVSAPRSPPNSNSPSWVPARPQLANIPLVNIGECSTPFSKSLSKSDVENSQSRLALTISKFERFLEPIMRPGEIKDLQNPDGIDVVVYDIEGQVEYEMKFKQWKRMIVLIKGWMDFVKAHHLKERVEVGNVDIAVWMFRRTDRPGLFFALALRNLPSLAAMEEQ